MHPAENCSNVGLDRVVRCLEWFYLIYVYCQVVGSSWTVLYCWTAGLVVDWVAGRVNGSAACMAAAKTWRCARCVIACDGVEPGHALESLDIGRHGTVLISGHSTYDNRRRPAWVRFNARCRCYGHLDRSRSLFCLFFFTHGAPCIVLDPFNCCMRHHRRAPAGVSGGSVTVTLLHHEGTEFINFGSVRAGRVPAIGR